MRSAHETRHEVAVCTYDDKPACPRCGHGQSTTPKSCRFPKQASYRKQALVQKQCLPTRWFVCIAEHAWQAAMSGPQDRTVRRTRSSEPRHSVTWQHAQAAFIPASTPRNHAVRSKSILYQPLLPTALPDHADSCQAVSPDDSQPSACIRAAATWPATSRSSWGSGARGGWPPRRRA
jgi:hypothetical protein